MKDDAWKTLITDAIRSCHIKGRVTVTEAGRLISSLSKPIDVIQPFDILTKYICDKANEEFEQDK